MSFAGFAIADDCTPSFYRWEELCSTEQAGAPWRHVPVDSRGDLWATFGGDYRLRADYVSDDEFGLGSGGEFVALTQRLYLHGELRAAEGTRLFVQMVAADQDGREPAPRSFDETSPDIAQAFADFSLGEASLRLGRQEVNLDGNRLIAIRDAGIRRTFDGARLDLPLARRASLTAFWYRPVFVSPGAFDDHSSDAEVFVGVDMRLDLGETLSMDLYAFDRDRRSATWASVAGPEERRTYGARWTWRGDSYDAALQVAYQDGEASGQSIEASGGTLDAGIRLQHSWAPRVGLTLGYAAGDEDRNDSELNTFDPHYPIVSLLTEAPVYFPANLTHAGLDLTFAPSPDLTLRLEALRFARAAQADAIYSSIGDVLVSSPQGGLASSNVIVANIVWAPTPHFDVQVQLVHATPLGALARVGGEDLSYGLFQASVHF
jgi:hypothetical protein